MKKTARISAFIVVGLLAIMLLLQWGLQKQLTPVVQRVLPLIQQQTGLQVELEHAAINLFLGEVVLRELMAVHPEVGDTPLLSVPRAGVAIRWKPLLQGHLVIRDLALDNAHVTLVRMPDGRVPIPEMAEAPVPPPDPEPEVPVDPAVEETPVVIPPAVLEKADVSVFLTYEDRATDEAAPRSITLELQLAAQNIATWPFQGDDAWGHVRIQSASTSHPGAFAADLDIRLAPLVDIDAISADVTGRVMDVNLDAFGDLVDKIGVNSESVDITLDLRIRDHAFASGSVIKATVRNGQLTGDLERKNRNVRLPETISLHLPVSGTLDAPSINVTQAITQSVLRNIADNPDYILDEIRVDGQSLRDRLRGLRNR